MVETQVEELISSKGSWNLGKVPAGEMGLMSLAVGDLLPLTH